MAQVVSKPRYDPSSPHVRSVHRTLEPHIMSGASPITYFAMQQQCTIPYTEKADRFFRPSERTTTAHTHKCTLTQLASKKARSPNCAVRDGCPRTYWVSVSRGRDARLAAAWSWTWWFCASNRLRRSSTFPGSRSNPAFVFGFPRRS